MIPSSSLQKPSVFSIPSGTSFLKTFACALIEGVFDPHKRRLVDDPTALTSTHIYLPTRRAAKILQKELYGQAQKPVLLPHITAISDDPAQDFFSFQTIDEAYEKPPVSAFHRQLILTDFMMRFSEPLQQALQYISKDETFPFSTQPHDAFHFAQGLSDIMDRMTRAHIAWDKLDTVMSDDYAQYWQITREILNIARLYWPDYLKEQQRHDPVQATEYFLAQRSAEMAEKAKHHPVIIAGSTGSVMATRLFMKEILQSPYGHIILPGFDLDMNDQAYDCLTKDKDTLTHPQYGFADLLRFLDVDRDDLKPLGRVAEPIKLRSKIFQRAFASISQTSSWFASHKDAQEDLKKAFHHMALIEAHDDEEEARTIALLLKHSLQEGHQQIAVVTPDRTLAARIIAQAKLFDLDLDDSGGTHLHTQPVGVLVQCVLDLVLKEWSAARFLSLIKHPLVSCGLTRAQCRKGASLLDLHLLRGYHAPSSLDALYKLLIAMKEEDSHSPLHGDDCSLCLQLVETLKSLFDVFQIEMQSFSQWALYLKQCLLGLNKKAYACDLDKDLFHSHEDGEALAHLFEQVEAFSSDLLMCSCEEAFHLFQALLYDTSFRKKTYRSYPIVIWGPLEARLQHSDVVILAGLNENVWPAQAATHPLLSRGMQMQLGLEPDERRIGLAAHDLYQLSAIEKCFLTRSQKSGGSPTVPSRWLQRLKAVLPQDLYKDLCHRGQESLELSRFLDQPAVPIKPLKRPCPKPPLSARPFKLSVTRIRDLIRDPYSLYARSCLTLKPLQKLDMQVDMAQRGTLYHDVLARFTKKADFAEKFEVLYPLLMQFFDQALVHFQIREEDGLLWRHHFERVGSQWLKWEKERHQHVKKRYAEIKGERIFTFPDFEFTLYGRADRVDLMQDQSLMLYDFKTGTPPSAKEMAYGLEPQLILEALIADKGGFLDDRHQSIQGSLDHGSGSYLYFSGAQKGFCEEKRLPFMRQPHQMSMQDLILRSEDEFKKLLHAFYVEERGYASQLYPKRGQSFKGDYDHLARISEWQSFEEREA